MTKPKVLVTGANGLIGGLMLRDLADRYDFSGLSRHAVAGIPYTEASVTDLEAVRRAVDGVDMVLHLAGETKNDDNWDDHFQVTAGGTINVLRAAAEAGVRRVVFMSTGSTMCGWEWDDTLPYGELARGARDLPEWELLDYATPPRPDSPYGVAKLFGEAAARWFSDRTPLSVLVIRLGAVLASNRPQLIRHFPGFLAQEDAVQLIDRCLAAPATVKFGIFDAISENSTPLARHLTGQGHPRLAADRLVGPIRPVGAHALTPTIHATTVTEPAWVAGSLRGFVRP